MLLILFRHGTAEDTSPDAQRELTKEGREEVKAVSRALVRFGIKPRVVLSSHRVRAIQTAGIAADELEVKVNIEQDDAIDSESDWDQFRSFVNGRLNEEKDNVVVLCAGHQPQFGRLARMALDAIDEDMDLRKGSAMGIRFKGSIAPGEGRLEFYLTPKFAAEMKK